MRVTWASVILYLVFSTPTARAIDCSVCSTLAAEYESLREQERKASQQLSENQAMLSSLAPDAVSKKIKLTSNILILSARVETLANNREVKKQEFDRMECARCQTQ